MGITAEGYFTENETTPRHLTSLNWLAATRFGGGGVSADSAPSSGTPLKYVPKHSDFRDAFMTRADTVLVEVAASMKYLKLIF